MADLIDRDALVSNVSGHVISMSVCLSKEERYGMERMFNTIMNDIQIAPAVNRWISVEDALPEQSGFYLAYFTFKDGTHAIDIAYINTGCCLGSITHWMPLPEPPESE